MAGPRPASPRVRACAAWVGEAGGVRAGLAGPPPPCVGTQLGSLGPGSPPRPPRRSLVLRSPAPGGAASPGLGVCGPHGGVRGFLWGQKGTFAPGRGFHGPGKRASCALRPWAAPCWACSSPVRISEPSAGCAPLSPSRSSPGRTVRPAHFSNQRKRSHWSGPGRLECAWYLRPLLAEPGQAGSHAGVVQPAKTDCLRGRKPPRWRRGSGPSEAFGVLAVGACSLHLLTQAGGGDGVCVGREPQGRADGSAGHSHRRAASVDSQQRRGPAAVIDGAGPAEGKAIYGARAQRYRLGPAK